MSKAAERKIILSLKTKIIFFFSETLKLETRFVDLILSELKYLNIIEHGDLVSFKLFQAFELATPNYQQVLIRSIPDIIDVGRHDEAMERLMYVFSEACRLIKVKRFLISFV